MKAFLWLACALRCIVVFCMQDGFEKLNIPGETLRGRIRIQYVDSFGEIEAGVDGGGLFKDFMENLIKEGFDPRIGLFKATSDQKLYPNPAAATVELNAFALFEFMGKMVGKALYEVRLISSHAMILTQ